MISDRTIAIFAFAEVFDLEALKGIPESIRNRACGECALTPIRAAQRARLPAPGSPRLR
jgi:hypothetical protein